MEWTQIAIPVIAYLLGMAFAGSFLGRKWMGVADIALHRLLRRKITIAQYFYWRYILGISKPPQPASIRGLSKTLDAVMGVVARLGVGAKPANH
jgi:hypothetical protein